MVGIKNFLGSIIGMMVGLEKFCVKITLLVCVGGDGGGRGHKKLDSVQLLKFILSV